MIDFNSNTEELIQIRKDARANKNWIASDLIRNELDNRLVFVFDTKQGEDVYYLTESYFKFKFKRLDTEAMSNRQYVEYIIKRDINAENNFNSWLFSHTVK